MALSEHEQLYKTCCTLLICPQMLYSCTSDCKSHNSQIPPGKQSTHVDRAVLYGPLVQQSSLAYRRPELVFPKQRMNEPWAFNVAVVFWQFETYQRSGW